MTLPILYSLQNCPYAMRAMLALSPKGTVPSTHVIGESLDIMLWALNLSDPDNLLYAEDAKALPEMLLKAA